MKKIFLVGIINLVINLSNAQNPAIKLTLQQCIETAIANNLPVGQSYLQLQSDSLNWKQAKWDRWPNLNASVTHGINQGRSIDPFSNTYINQQVSFSNYSIGSGVVLFNGLVLQNRVKQNELAYKASKMDWQQSKDNLTISVILAYLQVLTNEDLLKQLQSQADLSKKQVERLDVLNQQGAIPPFQFSDMKGQYANDQLGMVNARNAIESSKLVLCQLINIPYTKNMTLERLETGIVAARYNDTPEEIYQTALKEFSLAKAVEFRTKSNKAAIKVAKGLLFPTLSFNANASTNYSNAARRDVFVNNTVLTSTDYVTINNVQYPVLKQASNYTSEKIAYGNQLSNNLFSSFSLNLRIPIFNSFQAKSRVKMAIINFRNSELTEKTTKTQLQISIEQAYVNMNTAFDRYKILLEQVNAYNESFRAAEIRFNAGVGTSIEYLAAKNNLDRSNIDFINAGYDLALRVKILDYYQGKLLW